MERKHIGIIVGLMLVITLIAFGVGFVSARGRHRDHDGAGGKAAAEKKTIWTCSMHPQIRQPKPGKCPICGMKLIPLEAGAGNEGPRDLTLSETAKKLAQVEVVPVRRKSLTKTVRLVGKVDYDETRVATIAAWVPGRLDRLYVDYTGVAVRPGDHLVRMYSPEILTAEQELLQALAAEKQIRASAQAELRRAARATVEAAREKLRLWGLTREQVAAIEKKGIASDHITINAPIGGIVIHKNAVEGAYVKTGSPIYRIADLRQVWVKLDAYESDLPWLRYAQPVEFTSESWPGETFKGRISFIDPVLTRSTRTIKVRVNVPNEKAKLKPGMFVRAAIRVTLGAGGQVKAPDLAGKWISPMHPEIVKDKPGTCDICGMPLVTAAQLGFADNTDNDGALPLVIPDSAALLTGKRAIVYVQTGPAKFTGREVVLGPRANDFYIVKKGLKEGEKVVVNGNFKIDSALQIAAKPSMMSPAEEDAEPAKAQHFSVPAAFSKQLAALFEAYFKIQQDLGKDQSEAAAKDADKLLRALAAVDMKLVSGNAHMTWMKLHNQIRKAAADLKNAGDLEKRRMQFKTLSGILKTVAKTFGTGKKAVYVNTCPMAFNNTGAEWLQEEEKLLNPYYGSMMPTCGERVETIESAKPKPPTPKPEGTRMPEGSHHGH